MTFESAFITGQGITGRGKDAGAFTEMDLAG
ncbi:hypothetical protein J2Z65_003762 [Paenibacillus aceris]|uniref:Uncharacterized protein n=1 Tax=Paenibacillus aceris TaxID=869555 RepID=A0ABS4I2Y9_9BACL|nr:hypothetical protein [Paenibacillus aceris]